jgi:hypothetical protein
MLVCNESCFVAYVKKISIKTGKLKFVYDLQVDAYRNAGKEEAAARLEDQLSLIHTKFQVVKSFPVLYFLIFKSYLKLCTVPYVPVPLQLARRRVSNNKKIRFFLIQTFHM